MKRQAPTFVSPNSTESIRIAPRTSKHHLQHAVRSRKRLDTRHAVLGSDESLRLRAVLTLVYDAVAGVIPKGVDVVLFAEVVGSVVSKLVLAFALAVGHVVDGAGLGAANKQDRKKGSELHCGVRGGGVKVGEASPWFVVPLRIFVDAMA